MSDPDDPREIMATQLLMRGHATMKELLTVSFGEWPPNGLDINLDIPHDQKVVLITDQDSPDLGRSDSIDRTITVNDRLCRNVPEGIASTLAHEGIHMLQGSNYWLNGIHEIYGTEQDSRIREGHDDRISNTIMKKLTDEDGRQKRLSSTFNKTADSEQLSYLSLGTEMQARIHQTMMAGYKCWGVLPQNHDELWAALMEYGIMPPPTIGKHLKSLPENSHARIFMKSNTHPFETWELQQVNESLSEPVRDLFWRETLPALYADLIEMYGDRQGRERFGFGVNIKGQIQKDIFSKAVHQLCKRGAADITKSPDNSKVGGKICGLEVGTAPTRPVASAKAAPFFMSGTDGLPL